MKLKSYSDFNESVFDQVHKRKAALTIATDVTEKKTFTSSEIETISDKIGLEYETKIIGGKFNGKEYKVVKLKPFTYAYFKMDEKTFDFEFEKVYDAAKDKTIYKLPKQFESSVWGTLRYSKDTIGDYFEDINDREIIKLFQKVNIDAKRLHELEFSSNRYLPQSMFKEDRLLSKEMERMTKGEIDFIGLGKAEGTTVVLMSGDSTAVTYFIEVI